MPEQLEILKFISTTHRDLFKERRVHEWKLFIGTITVYILSAASVLFNKPTISLAGNCLSIIFIFLVSFLFGALSIVYLCFMHKGNRINKKFAETAERCLIKISESETLLKVHEEIYERTHAGSFDFGLLLKSLIITIFAVVTPTIISCVI